MREYKRSGASYAKDIVLTLLATAVAGGGVWLLQRYVMPEIAGTAGVLALYAIPVVVFAGMLYITFVADSVKLSLKPNGTVTYRRAGAKPLKWNAANCYFDWLNASQTSGNTTPHDITLRVSELNGEVAEVDCSPLGRRNFERFMRDVGEIALWRRPEDVLRPPELPQEPGLPGQMTLEGVAQLEEAEQEPVALPEDKKEKRKTRKQRKEAELAAELEELAEQDELVDDWQAQEELPGEVLEKEPVQEQVMEPQQVWPQEPVAEEALEQDQWVPPVAEPLAQEQTPLQQNNTVVSAPAPANETIPPSAPVPFEAEEEPLAPPAAAPVVVKPILPGDEPPAPPRREEPEVFRVVPVEPAAPVKPILPGDPLPPEPEVLQQEVVEKEKAEKADTQIVIPRSGMPQPVLHNAPQEEPAPEQEEKPRSLFAAMVRQGKEQAAQTAGVKEQETEPKTEQGELETPPVEQPKAAEALPVAPEEPFLQEVAAEQKTMVEQPLEALAQQLETQTAQMEQEVPLQDLLVEQQALELRREEPALAPKEPQAEQRTPGKRWRMKKQEESQE